jgi:hypothetical protein
MGNTDILPEDEKNCLNCPHCKALNEEVGCRKDQWWSTANVPTRIVKQEYIIKSGKWVHFFDRAREFGRRRAEGCLYFE